MTVKPEIFVVMTLPLGLDGRPVDSYSFQYTAIRCVPDTVLSTAAPLLVNMVNMGIFSLKMINAISAMMTGPGCVAVAAPPGCWELVPAEHYSYFLIDCDPTMLDDKLDAWEEVHKMKVLTLMAPEFMVAMRQAIAELDKAPARLLN